jgi:serine phosphatase RsbU (regulator of sigma subunit)
MRLESGERLVLVTDGVRETKSPAGEEFGVARVLEALRGASGAEQDVARMLDSVHRFSDGVREDDLTILSIARR